MKAKKTTVCYKSTEGVAVLNLKLTVRKKYKFSDVLQEEKEFKVKWKKGVLDKIDKHPYSDNCFVSNGQYFLYAQELKNNQ